MARTPIKAVIHPPIRQDFRRLLAAWLLALLLVAAIWAMAFSGAALGQPGWLLTLFGLQVGLTYILEVCLMTWVNALPARLRLAFGLSCVQFTLCLAVWILRLKAPLNGAALFTLLAGLSGAFIGGLAATARRSGLWEDNAPPAADIADAVFQRHKMVIGELPSTPISKRAFDFSLAVLGMLLSAPVWLASILLIWLEEPGPLLFVKNSTGKGGRNFHQFKLRTMVRQAEQATGPVLTQEDDERVLVVGRLLRKTALDELPQLLNILRGEMSFVGPRPQRTVLVYGYLQELSEYAERHRVAPGLAGLAQVVGGYYLSPRQKLRLDRLYIRQWSFGFDLKLLFLAFSIAFYFRWRKGWNGRLPRRLLRAFSPASAAG
jgi:lipopolysaccharide/colanic/teichoic acid biosynthesis glycosyltransferase